MCVFIFENHSLLKWTVGTYNILRVTLRSSLRFISKLNHAVKQFYQKVWEQQFSYYGIYLEKIKLDKWQLETRHRRNICSLMMVFYTFFCLSCQVMVAWWCLPIWTDRYSGRHCCGYKRVRVHNIQSFQNSLY